MAFLCQRHDGNLLFPHPRPSPATTVFVFGTAARAGEGGRWPNAVPNAVPHAVPNADERGRTARGVSSESTTDGSIAPRGGKPGERVASATWWKRSQHIRGSNATRVSNYGEEKSGKHAAKCGVRKSIAPGTRSPAS